VSTIDEATLGDAPRAGREKAAAPHVPLVIAWRWLKNLPMLWVSVVGVFLGVASILVVDSIFNGVLARAARRLARARADLTCRWSCRAAPA
jgi:hypothetical protein